MDYHPRKGGVWAEFLSGALLLGSHPNFGASQHRTRRSGGAGRFVRGTRQMLLVLGGTGTSGHPWAHGVLRLSLLVALALWARNYTFVLLAYC